MDYKNLDARLQQYWKQQKQFRKEVVEAIHDLCMENGGTVEFVDREHGDYNTIYIIYDGGNHPEYNSTISNEVFSVTACTTKEGVKTFICNTECSDEYGEERMPFSDVSDIYDNILAVLAKKNEEPMFIAIIDHETHELITETADQKEIRENYDGEEEYIAEKYPHLKSGIEYGMVTWEWITNIVEN